MVEQELSEKSSNEKNNQEKKGLSSIVQKFWKQTLILGGSAIICAGFLGAAWHSHQTYKAQVIKEHLTLMQQTADSTAKSISNFLTEHKQQLELVANNPEFIQVILNKQKDHIGDNDCLMGALYHINENEVDGLCAINSKGIVTDSHPHDIGLIGTNISSQFEFLEVQKTHKAYVSEVLERKNGIDYAITITIPVFTAGKGEKKFKGALQWIVNSDTLYDNFLDSDLINPDDIWILDNKGTIVTHGNGMHIGDNCMQMHLDTFSDINWSELENMLNTMQDKQKGQGMYSCSYFSNPNNIIKTKLVSYSPIQLGNNFWMVGVTKDYKIVSAPIEKRVNHTILATAAFLTLFGGLGLGFYFSQKKRALLESETEHLKEISKANEAVILAQSQFKTIYENAPTGMVLADLEGKFLKVNKAMCEFVGYTENELLSKTFQDISYPGDICLGVKAAQQVLLGDLNSQYFEKRCFHKDGRTVWANLTISSVRLSDDEPVYLVAQIQDITSKKQAEKDKANLEKKLQQAQKMKALGTLAGGVAHQLKDSLCIINGYQSLILELAEQNSPVREPIELMQESGEKVTEIVNDLLALSKPQKIGSEQIQLNDLILTYLTGDDFEELQENKTDFTLVTEFEKKLNSIQGSSEQITKTLSNLVSNAVNALGTKGKITISTKNQYIEKPLNEFDTISYGHYAVLGIEDNGKGIAPDEQSKIFEPFYTKNEKKKNGTGLGLAVVWKVVEDHNGHIDVQSKLGCGSKFEIYFPATRNIKKEN